MRHVRGKEISMIFQDPMTSLNPVFTIGDQIMESLTYHQNMGKTEARKRTIQMLKLVGITDADRRIKEYPHMMSGGMRQRIMIAMALSCNPKLLIADEPTTALDVTIQAQILDLMRDLRNKVGSAIILITHDLGVIAELVDHVVIMYAGKLIERSDVISIFKKPLHPYTEGLLRSIPRLDEEHDRLPTIEGVVPNLQRFFPGCRFRSRCGFDRNHCRDEEPPLIEVEPGHWAACWKYWK
jgi:oligopeptide/dipeptide ABC transporter ATP-binding protein